MGILNLINDVQKWAEHFEMSNNRAPNDLKELAQYMVRVGSPSDDSVEADAVMSAKQATLPSANPKNNTMNKWTNAVAKRKTYEDALADNYFGEDKF